MSFEPNSFITRVPLRLRIPRAHEWHSGMKIGTPDQKDLFHVVENTNDGSDREPEYRMVLSVNDHVESAVQVYRGAFSGMFRLYTKSPSYPEQPKSIKVLSPATSILSNDSVATSATPHQELYLHAKMKGGKMIQKYTGKHTKWPMYKFTTIACGPGGCLGISISSKKVILLCDPQDTKSVLLIRDQMEDTLEISPGQDAIIAISLCYAVDRLVKLLGSKQEKASRQSISWVV